MGIPKIALLKIYVFYVQTVILKLLLIKVEIKEKVDILEW